VNVLLLLLYALATAAYALHFARRTPASGRSVSALLLLTAVTHTFIIGMQTMEVSGEPMVSSSPSRAISTFVWLLTLSYLYLEIATAERTMGAFILPIAAGLQAIATFFPRTAAPDPVLSSHDHWFWLHMASLLFAYASFALAGMLGVIYVLQFKEIKKKQLGFFYTRLPSLQILDAMNARAVTIGLVFLTIGVIVGVVWVEQARVEYLDNSNLAAMKLDDPKVFVALITWGVYGFSVFARRTIGWAGTRAAWLSAAGFAVVLLNLVLVSYFIPNSHRFAGPAIDGTEQAGRGPSGVPWGGSERPGF
jgi:ABC-type transport system involved in cytochrome c biogenesis permease subunit